MGGREGWWRWRWNGEVEKKGRTNPIFVQIGKLQVKAFEKEKKKFFSFFLGVFFSNGRLRPVRRANP